MPEIAVKGSFFNSSYQAYERHLTPNTKFITPNANGKIQFFASVQDRNGNEATYERNFSVSSNQTLSFDELNQILDYNKKDIGLNIK